jgi:hypothetical protein
MCYNLIIHILKYVLKRNSSVWLEHWNHNPNVVGSNPSFVIFNIELLQN